MSSIKTSEKQQSARDARCQARFNFQNETNLRFYKSEILDLFQFCFNEMYLNYQFNWSSQKYNEVFEPENAKAFFIKDLMEDSKIVLAFMSELRWKSLRLCLLDEDNGFHLELLSHLNFYERKNIDKFILNNLNNVYTTKTFKIFKYNSKNVKYSFFCNEALKNRQNAMIFCNGESKIDVEKLGAKNEITCEEVTEETMNDILFKHKAKNYVYDYSIDYEIPSSESEMSFEESDEEIVSTQKDKFTHSYSTKSKENEKLNVSLDASNNDDESTKLVID